jgi:hypothetical protein
MSDLIREARGWRYQVLSPRPKDTAHLLERLADALEAAGARIEELSRHLAPAAETYQRLLAAEARVRELEHGVREPSDWSYVQGICRPLVDPNDQPKDPR